MNSALELFLRVFLAFIFLSSAISKYNNFDKHIGIISDYKVIPSNFSKIAGRLDFIAELAVGILLIIGLLEIVAIIGAVSLLFVYITAISINLLRGRTEISCGCGGVLGNHQLSWKLVVRNILLIITALLISFNKNSLFSIDTLINTNNPVYAFGYKSWQYLIISICIIILLLLIRELIHIIENFNKIISSLKNNN
ncbi:DoxX family membrane protein (plasmid) [Priestia megaterium]|uniref:MauE/DoxX family redox-associated membrane protein n=1 Tax=Priestia megaterium TaxID=1404 RepID=UPI00196ACE7A|nr:MauE/DoxX family redox-associated membrane protein [Priestia megaterium]QSF35850.1 DoxX family membrane protein [Priestia megaterium]